MDKTETTGWVEIDLAETKDEPKVEIVTEEAPVETPPVEAPPKEAEEVKVDSEDSGDTLPSKRTRSQRLKFQRDRERAAREAAEARAFELEQRLNSLETERQEALKVGTEKLAKSMDSLIGAAEHKLKIALSEQDPDKASAAQREMSELIAERSKIPATVESKPKPTTPPPQEKPREYAPEAIDWAKRNSNWFGKDRVLTAAAYAIDAELTEEGFDPSNDEYYSELEKRLVEENPKRAKACFKTEEKPEEKAKPKAPVAAGSTTTGSTAPKSIRLTAEEVEHARQLGVDLKTYAANKLALEQKDLNGYTAIGV